MKAQVFIDKNTKITISDNTQITIVDQELISESEINGEDNIILKDSKTNSSVVYNTTKNESSKKDIQSKTSNSKDLFYENIVTHEAIVLVTDKIDKNGSLVLNEVKASYNIPLSNNGHYISSNIIHIALIDTFDYFIPNNKYSLKKALIVNAQNQYDFLLISEYWNPPKV